MLPIVLLQLATAPEHHMTLRALVRSGVRVHRRVQTQEVHVLEPTSTVGTRESQHVGVCDLVVIARAVLLEPLVAAFDATGVRSLTGVNQHV